MDVTEIVKVLHAIDVTLSIIIVMLGIIAGILMIK